MCIRDRSYGAPETLGEARKRLLESPLGDRIRIDLNFDIMAKEAFFENRFDYVVLSHCLWYFASFEELQNTLKQLKAMGKYLCLAEWNPCIGQSEQLAHLKAVSIEAFCECFKNSSESNVRTMFYPSDIKRALQESGWKVEKEDSIYSPDIQDGKWEVGMVTQIYPAEIAEIAHMPEKMKRLLFSQIEELKEAKNIRPLSAYCIRAE